jgi:hypothetical protein
MNQSEVNKDIQTPINNSETIDPKVYQKTKAPEFSLDDLKISNFPDELVAVVEAIPESSGFLNPVEIVTPSAQSIQIEKAKVFRSFITDQGLDYNSFTLDPNNKTDQDVSSGYNPEFDYAYAKGLDLTDPKRKLEELREKLHSIGADSDSGNSLPNEINKRAVLRIAKLFILHKINDDLSSIEIADAIKKEDEQRLDRAFKNKYPGVDDALEQKAAEIYRLKTEGKDKTKTTNENPILNSEEVKFLESRTVKPEQVKSAFEWALNQYGVLKDNLRVDGIEGYSVVISNEVQFIDVRDKSKNGPTIFIPENPSTPITELKLLSYIAHEIEGHVRQSINGEKLFVLGGGKLKIDNETLYEGLAKRNDEKFTVEFLGTEEGMPDPSYTFAVKLAQEGKSFYEIFSDQVERDLHIQLKILPEDMLPEPSHIDHKILIDSLNKAWKITYRTMRGHTDMENPHAFANAKDLSYLRGWMLDHDLITHDVGYLNEAAIIHNRALKLLSEFDLDEEQLPIRSQNLPLKYWEEVIKPNLVNNQSPLIPISPENSAGEELIDSSKNQEPSNIIILKALDQFFSKNKIKNAELSTVLPEGYQSSLINKFRGLLSRKKNSSQLKVESDEFRGYEQVTNADCAASCFRSILHSTAGYTFEDESYKKFLKQAHDHGWARAVGDEISLDLRAFLFFESDEFKDLNPEVDISVVSKNNLSVDDLVQVVQTAKTDSEQKRLLTLLPISSSTNREYNHLVLLRSIEEDWVTVFDPKTGNDQKLLKSEFIKKWSDIRQKTPTRTSNERSIVDELNQGILRPAIFIFIKPKSETNEK